MTGTASTDLAAPKRLTPGHDLLPLFLADPDALCCARRAGWSPASIIACQGNSEALNHKRAAGRTRRVGRCCTLQALGTPWSILCLPVSAAMRTAVPQSRASMRPSCKSRYLLIRSDHDRQRASADRAYFLNRLSYRLAWHPGVSQTHHLQLFSTGQCFCQSQTRLRLHPPCVPAIEKIHELSASVITVTMCPLQDVLQAGCVGAWLAMLSGEKSGADPQCLRCTQPQSWHLRRKLQAAV